MLYRRENLFAYCAPQELPAGDSHRVHIWLPHSKGTCLQAREPPWGFIHLQTHTLGWRTAPRAVVPQDQAPKALGAVGSQPFGTTALGNVCRHQWNGSVVTRHPGTPKTAPNYSICLYPKSQMGWLWRRISERLGWLTLCWSMPFFSIHFPTASYTFVCTVK